MNKKVMIVIWVIVALLVVGVVKDIVIKVAVEGGVQFVTGLRMGISNFNVGIVRTVVNIRGLKIYNPKGFKDKVMLEMPQIYVNYDLPAIFGGLVHLRDVRVNMKELLVEKNEKGELNINSIKVVKAGKGGAQPSGEQGKAPKIKIDKLHLKIGKAVYKDYSKGGAPDVREFNVNIDETYTNIDNPNALVGLIVVRALANTTISSLANFDIGGLQSTVSDALSQAQATADQAKAVVGNVGDVTKDLQNVFKNPFGK